jgi:hypothetical protein
MKRYIFALLVLFSLECVSQGVEIYDSMDVRVYNETLRIWQLTVNDKLDVYKVVLDVGRSSIVLRRKSDGHVLEFSEVVIFREEGGVFVFSAWLVTDKGKFPASGLVYDGGLRINLGDLIYVFSKVEVEDDGRT